MSLQGGLSGNEEVVLLAMEIAALDAVSALDSAVDGEVLQAVELHGPVPAVAGLVLTFFSKMEAARASLLWRRLTVVVRNDLARLMLAIQPQVTVRSLGVFNLQDCLRSAADPQFHEMVAQAIASAFVSESESCLEFLLPAARDKLALILAERSGREADQRPAFISKLPEYSQRRSVRAMAFGALIACRRTLFSEAVSDFSAEDWAAMMATAQKRADELGSTGISMLLTSAPDHIKISLKSSRHETARWKAAFPGSADHSGHEIHENIEAADARPRTSADEAVAIIASASTAVSDDLPRLSERCSKIQGRTWRREAQSAVLRRAYAIGLRLPHPRNGLTHEEIGAIIADRRLHRGETAILTRRAWLGIGPARRFTLLMKAMSRLEAGAVAPTEARLGDVAGAILALSGAMRDVLALHFITSLGQLPAMTVKILDRFSQAEGRWQDDILTAIARSYALRGYTEVAQELMEVAQSVSEQRWRKDSFRRLQVLLDNPASVPTETVRAVVSTLATVSGSDLSAAIQLCFERLPKAESEFVMADVIARGRATDAFGDNFY